MKMSRVLFQASTFRETFHFGEREIAKWFPGHMAKGLKQMKASLKNVDCIIEVHDARIPLSGRNPLFHENLGIRPHLLLLNKMDLADLTEKQRILSNLMRHGIKNVIFTNCVKDENVKKVVPLITELIQASDRYQRAEALDYCIMVIGVPNVGKSSLINALRRCHLRKGKASRVGGEPGITRAVLSKIQLRCQLHQNMQKSFYKFREDDCHDNSYQFENVSERPPMFLLDTPGVLSPRIATIETGLKLALCGTILDHLVGEDVIADYLLYTLNKKQQFSYVERYALGEPCDDIESVLKRIAIKLKKTQKVKAITGVGDINMIMPNYPAAAYDFIRTFRKGDLGKVMLD
ncbi:mitochondrial ribosome-associated GTPase 1 isoform X1 [Rhinatrema bivittatum]|uniref:mitochondrial ribosome-associated GTPase 1 isoform X1 n=1 Tax=Rhinatrema bivittatum TaxID=194408 RepID=UPI001127BE00|nr:mitochondrial ribosome-associated GTPase 1 isoform X1 [Rhinatrema bivittatum]XP_029465462.1 mitochondrial ribosome-associated GTPase 1 isoform X1 [Rhinatrema bivittatum]XP_029465463.1 mitochondrial ribosome-associated GTPase 1 isoform X1 [Rhinatrema bivittatum]